MKNSSKNLVIFARAPRYGLVKKRLSKTIGNSEALRYYNSIFCRSLRVLHDNNRRWTSWLAVTPIKDKLNYKNLKDWKIVDQGPGGIGERMMKVLLLMPKGPVVLVGSDIPNLEKQNISNAFKLLNGSDLVFGPAKDGGFWLIGVKKNFASGKNHLNNLFDSVRWSSCFALSDTLKNAKGSKVTFVEKMEDVDDFSGYNNNLR